MANEVAILSSSGGNLHVHIDADANDDVADLIQFGASSVRMPATAANQNITGHLIVAPIPTASDYPSDGVASADGQLSCRGRRQPGRSNTENQRPRPGGESGAPAACGRVCDSANTTTPSGTVAASFNTSLVELVC
jgi:hypothetical protein